MGLAERHLGCPPAWARQIIEPFDEADFQARQPYIVESYWSSQQSINVFDVVGTTCPDYAGMSWLDFLRHGKRMALNLDLQSRNPGYYLGQDVKLPAMDYVAVDDDRLFVGSDGNHRTAIARFMFHETGRTMLHGVTVTKHRTDKRARDIAEAVSTAILEHGLRIRVVPQRVKLSRQDTGGWMRERWRVEFDWADLSRGSTERLSLEELQRRAEELRRPSGWLRGLCGFFAARR